MSRLWCVVLGILALSATSAMAQSAPCYARFGGQMMFMFNGTFDSCARTIQAAKGGSPVGHGTWGGQQVAIDAYGNAMVNGRSVVVPNFRGTGPAMSLQDRCLAGDRMACAQWQRNLEAAIDGMNRMYQPGWAQR